MPGPPLITLLTDFGERDYFVASMKGVILTINPEARIVDLTHQITPHDVEEAAYFLKSCYQHFPKGTIHIAVVDPGVGSARRPIAVKTPAYYFLAPDNGLLTHVLERDHRIEIREIENVRNRLKSQGSTFDGRDLFAPVAARLSTGQPLETFGRLIQDPVRMACATPRWENHVLIGQIVYIDRFGNLISNVTTKYLDEVRNMTGHQSLKLRIGDYAIGGFVASYSEGSQERLSAIVNSNGCVELFLREKNAAESLKISRGESIFVS